MLPRIKSEKLLTGRLMEYKALFQDKIDVLFDQLQSILPHT